MKQDAALEKWIEEDMRDVPCAMPVDEAGEYMCRAAWFAAVKHTLAFVADELRISLEEEFQFAEKVADQVLNMKP